MTLGPFVGIPWLAYVSHLVPGRFSHRTLGGSGRGQDCRFLRCYSVSEAVSLRPARVTDVDDDRCPDGPDCIPRGHGICVSRGGPSSKPPSSEFGWFWSGN